MSANLILLIDDARTILEMERAMLEPSGYHVVTAQSAEEGRELLKEISPQVIVLDVIMPGMNGIDFCRELRDTERFRGVPILMVTSQVDEEYVDEAYGAGCTDYLTKPIERAELVAKIAQYVQGAAQAATTPGFPLGSGGNT